MHCNLPIVPTFGRYSCVAPATAIKIYDILTINPPRKLMEEYWFLAPILRLAIPSALLNVFFFFSETLHDNLPVVRAMQLGRSMKKTASCKKATELPG